MITHRDLMHASPAPQPFSSPGWIFEFKFDGFRTLAVYEAGRARLISRAGREVGHLFPEVLAALQKLPEIVIDGELVVLDPHGHPDYEGVRRRLLLATADSVRRAGKRNPAVLFAFDLLFLKGRDYRRLPLLHRKHALKKLLPRSERLVFADHVEEKGEALYQEAAARGLEGIVAKRAGAPYSAGRSTHWLKIKTPIGRDLEQARARELAPPKKRGRTPFLDL